MRAELEVNGNTDLSTNYITWSPAPCRVWLADLDEVTGPVRVTIRNQNRRQGGQVLFSSDRNDEGQAELELELPANGAPIDFFAAGQFGRPSAADKDAVVEVVESSMGTTLSLTPLMVRVRKNANDLTRGERTRFLSALATLNDRGMGRFSDFRNIHTEAGDPEAHGDAGFLPWHRAFLLDLERELQQIDPSVTLPYWRFDEPAPKLFRRAFIGVTDEAGSVQFGASNPLQFWTTDRALGITRTPRFNTARAAASNEGFPVLDETMTLQLGGNNNEYRLLLSLEGQPHGLAHTSFGGFLSDIDTAARDPLFFLLHANVDRLWAKWQWLNRRFDASNVQTYSFQGAAGDLGATTIGHNLNDTMWPWNQVTVPPRPQTAPGGAFPPSLITTAPGQSPAVREMIDYQGVVNPPNRLGFDYDDVPFET